MTDQQDVVDQLRGWLSECERELAEVREIGKVWFRDYEAMAAQRDAAEARLAEARLHLKRMQADLDRLSRELAEERELRQQYAEDAKRNLRDRDAAEASLAAVAQACDVWYVVVVDDEQVKYVERARVLAALSAPAEPSAVFMVGEGRFAPRTPAAEADGPYFPAHQMMTRIHELEARLAAVAGALNPGTPKFAFQVVADARAALSAPAGGGPAHPFDMGPGQNQDGSP